MSYSCMSSNIYILAKLQGVVEEEAEEWEVRGVATCNTQIIHLITILSAKLILKTEAAMKDKHILKTHILIMS